MYFSLSAKCKKEDGTHNQHREGFSFSNQSGQNREDSSAKSIFELKDGQKISAQVNQTKTEAAGDTRQTVEEKDQGSPEPSVVHPTKKLSHFLRKINLQMSEQL